MALTRGQEKRKKARTEGATQATPKQTFLEMESPTLDMSALAAAAKFATGRPRTVRRGGTTNSTKDTTTANKNTAPPTAAAMAGKISPGARYILPFRFSPDTTSGTSNMLPPIPSLHFPSIGGGGHFEVNFQIVGNPIGSGSFGTVYKCQSKLDERHYAVKEIKHSSGASKEARALATLSDYPASDAFPASHVVRYYSAWTEGGRLYIQTELCTSTLRSELDSRQPMSHKRRCKLLHSMLLCLTFIHERNICHLDIKPDNIFIKDDLYKLGDFGNAIEINVGGCVEEEEGDCRYMARELLDTVKCEDLPRCDVFSLGATMYEVCLVDRSLPPDGDEWHSIRDGTLQVMPDTDPALRSIITDMLHTKPHTTVLLKQMELLVLP